MRRKTIPETVMIGINIDWLRPNIKFYVSPRHDVVTL